jgi:hypothetical protein
LAGKNTFASQSAKSQRRSSAIIPASSIGKRHSSASAIATETTIRQNIDLSEYTVDPDDCDRKEICCVQNRLGSRLVRQLQLQLTTSSPAIRHLIFVGSLIFLCSSGCVEWFLTDFFFVNGSRKAGAALPLR